MNVCVDLYIIVLKQQNKSNFYGELFLKIWDQIQNALILRM